MNKIFKTALILVFLAAGAERSSASTPGGAVQRIDVFTFSAALYLADTQLPRIIHTGLERISSVTKYAVIKGTAADNIGLKSLSIAYYSSGDTAFSTATIALNGETQYCFNQAMTLGSAKNSDFFYKITAEDVNNGITIWPESGEFNCVKITPGRSKKFDVNGGKLILPDGNPDDGETSIELPDGALDAPADISISEIDPDDESVPRGNAPAISHRPLAVYRFEPSGLFFKKTVKINLLFRDFNKDGVVDGTLYGVNDMKIMWWDGFEWRLLASSVDKDMNLVSSRIKHFSYYAVFPVPALTDDDYRPKEKIITPASIDGYNDYATFGAVGPDEMINVFDVTGQRIREIRGDITWDGKDDRNELVESGIYIYQIKLKDKIISGTIVVAK
ncbi:MAG: hypothetical protein ABII64_05475 [Elusimicrobiota bacterium]